MGGENDVLSVKSVVYKSPGEKGRGRGRGRGSGWGVKEGATVKDKVTSLEKTPNDTTCVSGDTVWEKSRPGFTREGPLPETQQDSELEKEEKKKDGETADGAAATLKVKPRRDYSSLPALLGVPRIGDTIAFKVNSQMHRSLCMYTHCCIIHVGIGDISELYSRSLRL